jgi:hypothetical protein
VNDANLPVDVVAGVLNNTLRAALAHVPADAAEKKKKKKKKKKKNINKNIKNNIIQPWYGRWIQFFFPTGWIGLVNITTGVLKVGIWHALEQCERLVHVAPLGAAVVEPPEHGLHDQPVPTVAKVA